MDKIYIIIKTNYWRGASTSLYCNNYFNSLEEAKEFFHKGKEKDSDYQFTVECGKNKDTQGWNEHNILGIDHDGAWCEYWIRELKPQTL